MEIGVLFDLDGVLIDSESRYTEFWNEVEKTYPTGIPDFAIQIKGNTLPKILDTYFPQPERQTYIHRMLKDFEATMRYEPFQEAMRFVDELNASSIKCAIVTSSSINVNLSPVPLPPNRLKHSFISLSFLVTGKV